MVNAYDRPPSVEVGSIDAAPFFTLERAVDVEAAPLEWNCARVDDSLRLHTFATVVGLMLVSLARLKLGTEQSAREMMASLAAIETTLVRTRQEGRGRRPTTMLLPELTVEQARAAKVFEMERWVPGILSTSPKRRKQTGNAGEK